MKIDIIAIGQLRKGPMFDALAEYQKRITWPLTLIIHESKQRDERVKQREEHEKLLGSLSNSAFIIAMDEKGKSLPSSQFANKIKDLQNQGQSHVQFVIGGADGLSDDIRSRANLLLSFGAQTWPHMLARVMLLEQIYRCQQILAGHPYHRES
ncbi:MAG: 23S rRNA (pseudouridine(1915)-N(3))-methyltransferase RlmH [Alphaproteobacteria bacterium]|nr:23S rRNA (pseudouridine(1915)-N(3))-methyltransferase RlmH [Alphaproteobacteria bacterium]